MRVSIGTSVWSLFLGVLEHQSVGASEYQSVPWEGWLACRYIDLEECRVGALGHQFVGASARPE